MQLGDRYSFEKDGVIFTETIESVHYSSGTLAIYKTLNRWQRIIRRLTPPRLRKPLLIQPAQPPTITINDTRPDPVGKTIAQLEQMKTALRTTTV